MAAELTRDTFKVPVHADSSCSEVAPSNANASLNCSSLELLSQNMGACGSTRLALESLLTARTFTQLGQSSAGSKSDVQAATAACDTPELHGPPRYSL